MFEYETEQVLIFESGKKVLGLELDRVDSIIEKEAVTPVPGVPKSAEGIIFYRDRVIPVLDLISFLYENNNSEGSGKLLVVVRGLSEDFGISSDRIYGIVPANRLNIRHIPSEERENQNIQGKGEFNGIEFSFLDFKI